MTKIRTQDRNKLVATSVPAITASTGVTLATTYQTSYITKFTIPSTVQAVASAALGFGIELCTLPIGAVVVTGANFDLSYVASGANAIAADIGIGTVVASGAISVLSGTATMEDCITGQTATVLNGTTPVAWEVNVVTAEIDVKDGTTTANTLFLNIAGTWNVTVDITYTGTVTVAWYISHIS